MGRVLPVAKKKNGYAIASKSFSFFFFFFLNAAVTVRFYSKTIDGRRQKLILSFRDNRTLRLSNTTFCNPCYELPLKESPLGKGYTFVLSFFPLADNDVDFRKFQERANQYKIRKLFVSENDIVGLVFWQWRRSDRPSGEYSALMGGWGYRW